MGKDYLFFACHDRLHKYIFLVDGQLIWETRRQGYLERVYEENQRRQASDY